MSGTCAINKARGHPPAAGGASLGVGVCFSHRRVRLGRRTAWRCLATGPARQKTTQAGSLEAGSSSVNRQPERCAKVFFFFSILQLPVLSFLGKDSIFKQKDSRGENKKKLQQVTFWVKRNYSGKAIGRGTEAHPE